MSFQNFDSFPNQADGAAPGPGAPDADTAMAGQPDMAAASFQGPAPGEPNAAGAQQGADGKTTLWYVETVSRIPADQALTNIGWVSLSHGLMRTSSATSGSRWVSRSTSR